MQLARGQRVGAWVVEAELGAGGVAWVYRVRHPTTGLRRALKVLRLPTDSVRHRLLREGRTQAGLRHPGIVAVDEVIDVRGSPGLLMELVPGPTLRALLKKGRLAIDVVDRLGHDLLEAVAHAHAQGVVHRDLKPGNVLLAVVDGRVVPKVTDFGLARTLGPAEGGALATHSGVMLGTPAYMAPEQVDDAKRAGPPADVFALGALLYELACSERAFRGETTRAILDAAAAGRFHPPRAVRPDLPARMADAIEAALQRAPTDRPPDASALLGLWRGGTPAPTPVSEAVLAPCEVPHETTEEVPVDDDRTLALTLSTAPHDLVGRGVLFASVHRQLVPGAVVTLVGAGGVGKTALARALAGDAAVFVEAVAVRDAEGLAEALGAALGVREVEAVDAAVARHPGLVVLDNLEQVEGAAAALEAWASSSRATWLSTARRPVGVPGEWVVEVPPLPVEAAVELLRLRSPVPVPVAEAADIVARVDGLPLAVELAAARTAVLAPDRLAARLQSEAGADVLKDGTRSEARHRSLPLLLEGTRRLLPEASVAAAAALTVFVGPFRPVDAEAVLGEGALDALASLQHHALLQRQGERLRMLRPIARAVADWADVTTARERHAAHFARLGDADELDPAALVPVVDELGAAVDTWLAAGRPDDAARAARALGVAALGTARPEAPRRLKAVVARRPALPHQARLYTLLGMLADHVSRADRAERMLARAARAAEGRPDLLFNVHLARGNARRRSGDLEAADAAYAEAAALGIAEGSAAVRLLANRASVAAVRGDLRTAVAWGQEALDEAELGADDGLELVCQANLATYLARAGDLEPAAGLLRRVLPALEARGDLRTAGMMRANLARMLLELGRPEAAREAVVQALEEIDRSGDTRNSLDALWTLARVEQSLGSLGPARAAIHDSLEVARQLGYRDRERRNLVLAAELAEAEGDGEAASRLRAQVDALPR